jgi:hypothetical protein
MVLPFAALAPKIIIPSFFIAHKVRGEKKIEKIANTIAFTIMFAATIIILFQDEMPWIALITILSAVYFYQKTEDQVPNTPLISSLSLAIMGLTFFASRFSLVALIGAALYGASYFMDQPLVATASHLIGMLGFAYGVHEPSFVKEIAAICEHLT